jgi:hypothetical protein
MAIKTFNHNWSLPLSLILPENIDGNINKLECSTPGKLFEACQSILDIEVQIKKFMRNSSRDCQ